MFAEHLRFFDRYLKGIENGIDGEPPFHYYTYNAPAGEEWSTSENWPPAGTHRERYYLNSGAEGNELSRRRPAQPTVASFEVDYSAVLEDNATPFWPSSQHGRGLSFETAPFDRDVRITGHPLVSLCLSTTAADGDTFAYLEEVTADGEVRVRAHGRLRSSHRKLGTAPYDYLGLPWHRSFREDYLPMTPGEPAEHVFDLLPTSTIVKRGSRLRLVVTGADPRQRQHLNISPPPTVTVHSGADKASYIDLPVASDPHDGEPPS